MLTRLLSSYHCAIQGLRHLDFSVLLLIRLYLGPIFIVAGLGKWANLDSTIDWFGNTQWGLGLPMPELMAYLAIFAEVIGGFAIILGVLTRLFSIMLSITMAVAAVTVHWKNGWFAIAPSDSSTSIASLLANINFPGAQESMQNSTAVGVRLDRAKEILQTNANYDWLTETGNFVILNNGIEFAATYFILTLVLVFHGSGRWFSVDYWITPRKFKSEAGK